MPRLFLSPAEDEREELPRTQDGSVSVAISSLSLTSGLTPSSARQSASVNSNSPYDAASSRRTNRTGPTTSFSMPATNIAHGSMPGFEFLSNSGSTPSSPTPQQPHYRQPPPPQQQQRMSGAVLLPSSSTTTTGSTTPSRFVSPIAARSDVSLPLSRSPATGTRTPTLAATIRSVRLLCTSPDGRWMHALSHDCSAIETIALPLRDNDNHNNKNRNDDGATSPSQPSRRRLEIRTPLPDDIIALMEEDGPVLELISVEGESFQLQQQRQQQKALSPNLQLLPRICLYTRKAAFLLQLAYNDYDSNNCNSREKLLGQVLHVTEPFEKFLLESISASIVRIRPSPKTCHGSAVLCAPASMAALIYDDSTQLHTVLLYHGGKSNPESEEALTTTTTAPCVTRPLDFGVEEVADQNQERIVDFCFAQSNGLPIFPSLTMLLLRGSGDILAASPVVFHGTIVAKSIVQEGLDYLTYQLDRRDRSTAAWRQCRVAQQFLIDAFVSDPHSHFATIRLDTATRTNRLATTWPVQLQGPVLFHSNHPAASSSTSSTLPPLFATLEPFGASPAAVGLVMASIDGSHVDFAILASTSVLPRFAFESQQDSYELDDALFKLGSFVEFVSLGGGGGNNTSTSVSISPGSRNKVAGNENLVLLRDPVMDTVLHIVTPTAVRSISTNVIKVISRRLLLHEEQERKERNSNEMMIRTVAWSMLNVTSASNPIRGCHVLPGELGDHQLVARLADGSLVFGNNITEHFILQELKARADTTFDAAAASAETEVAVSEPIMPLLGTMIQPLVEKVQAGLANMSKVVGTETNVSDLTPEALSVAISIKERCDQDLVLPLLQLKKMVTARQELLYRTFQTQLMEQLERIKDSIRSIQDKNMALHEQIQQAASEAALDVERIKTIQQACTDILPTMTQAELNFIQDMKRLKIKCMKMEREMKRLSTQVTNMSTPSATARQGHHHHQKDMREHESSQAHAVLKDQERRLLGIRSRLEQVEQIVHQQAAQVDGGLVERLA